MSRVYWTPEADQLLLACAGREPMRQLALKLRVSHREAHMRRALLRAAQTRRVHRPWRHSEVQRLLQLVEAGKSQPEIAQALGRTLPGVNQRVFLLRAAGKLPPVAWTQEAEDRLREVRCCSNRVVAQFPGRTREAVRAKWAALRRGG